MDESGSGGGASEAAWSGRNADLRDHPRVHWERPAVEPDRVRRIVSLVPSLSEAVVALDLADRLVGVTEYCVEPPGAFEALPKVGGTKDADVESIAKLAPDLVIANQEENTARVVRKLADRGIDVWVTYPRTVREGAELLAALADLGASDTVRRRVVAPVLAAVREAEAQRAADSTRERLAEPGTESRPTVPARTRPRVFCPIWRDPWMTIGRDTYIHDLIELCGGENVFAGSPGSRERRYPVVSLEAVVAAAPEVVVLPDEPYAFGVRDAAELRGLDVPAARSGRIHLIDGSLVSWYGPRIAKAIQVLKSFLATAPSRSSRCSSG